jgi:hypothetical protein
LSKGETIVRVNRSTFAFVVVSLLFLSQGEAQAQTAVSYRFLEVVDTAGKPVADATVEPISSYSSPLKTDENGVVARIPVYQGDYNTTGLKVSKPGYYTYEDRHLFSHRHDILLQGEKPLYDPRERIKIELLKMPATSAERQTVEAEQRRLELLTASKHGDAATVRRLLHDGVKANAKDVHGIPAILWAITSGDAKTVQALLASKADVRSKNKPGRKALLYYLRYAIVNGQHNEALVRSLVKAGADVNAAESDGATVLMFAKQIGDAKIIKLLEKAGARSK